MLRYLTAQFKNIHTMATEADRGLTIDAFARDAGVTVPTTYGDRRTSQSGAELIAGRGSPNGNRSVSDRLTGIGGGKGHLLSVVNLCELQRRGAAHGSVETSCDPGLRKRLVASR
jgi:hypothetical protein